MTTTVLASRIATSIARRTDRAAAAYATAAIIVAVATRLCMTTMAAALTSNDEAASKDIAALVRDRRSTKESGAMMARSVTSFGTTISGVPMWGIMRTGSRYGRRQVSIRTALPRPSASVESAASIRRVSVSPAKNPAITKKSNIPGNKGAASVSPRSG